MKNWNLPIKPDSASDRAKVRAEVEEVLLPMARELRLVGQADGVDHLSSMLFNLNRARFASEGDVPADNPGDWALFQLCTVSLGVVFIEVAYNKNPEGNGYLDQMFHFVVVKVHYVRGYLRAMLDTRAANSRRGANGRRLIGATTREKARTAAEQFRGKHSRESAAPMVAELIGKSPAHVRKLLSELFPGDAWRADECDESADLSRLDQ